MNWFAIMLGIVILFFSWAWSRKDHPEKGERAVAVLLAGLAATTLLWEFAK
jgi:hypothetical protein